MRLRTLILAAIALGASASLSCSVNEYCVNCATDDGGGGDGNGTDGGPISDGHMGPDACAPTGAEICDGIDNDCDGKTDENTAQEPLPMVGDACSSNVGECTAGQIQCVAGKLTCSGKTPTAETCNNKDDNCDGMIDNGDPGGGGICGTDVGECISGVNHCVAGTVQCIGSVGTVGGQPEVCNGKDDDCDGIFDEDIAPLGTCGPAQGNVGQCQLGMLMCAGGGTVCVGAVYPTFELCDNIDQDCDGNPTNGYDLMNDPRNCMTCGHVCSLPHATAGCALGACTVASCDPGFYDINKDPSDGCEYACNFQGAIEACNGVDDNCNGQIDEGVVAPVGTCRTLGACVGSTATCQGASGFTCNYGPNVSLDAMGNIIPESTCDNIDNDCNGVVDDPFPTKGQTCHDANKGICQGSGSNICNATHDGVTCNITTPGQPMGTETCNGKDDDCNGIVDDGAASGNMPGQNWITMATGHQIMQFEASRPDSLASDQGTMATTPCSKSGVQPWTDVTAPQAAAACTSEGAHLCTEEEWQRACSVVTPTVYPIAGPTVGNDVYLEAEDFDKSAAATSTGTGAGTHVWEPDYTQGFNGMMAMHANPDLGANLALNVGLAQAPRLDFRVNFPTMATYYVWVRAYSPNNNGNSLGVGIVSGSTTPANPTLTVSTNANTTWQWRVSGAFTNISAGVGLVEVYMREDGMKVDAIVISRQNSTAPSTTTGPGNTWAYNATPNVYQPLVCNGHDSGNNDNVLACGALASCDANWGGAGKIFDMSGNVQEWTQPRVPGINPIRGGASNDIAGGLTCALSFGAADDSFFFPNVGFRCCR